MSSEKNQAARTEESPLVLVVDDNEDSLVLIGYVLEMLGINFIAAESGEDAITLSREHRFSLVLLDIVMPNCCGLSVLERLKASSNYRNIPIVAVSALALAADRSRLLASGFADYLAKPYALDRIDALVQKHAYC